MTLSPSPARGIGFVEAFRSREQVEVRIRSGGGPAHLDIHPGFGSRNPARIVFIRRKYSSAPSDSSRVGRDGWPGMRQTPLRIPGLFTGLTRISRILNYSVRCLAYGSRDGVSFVTRFACPSQLCNRWQRVVRYSRCTLNLFGPFQQAETPEVGE